MRFCLLCFVVFGLFVGSLNTASAKELKATIYRDNWGVPHIYADTAAEGALGLGYAQAEDRLEDIYVAIRTGMGTMSEAFGKNFVDHDYLMRMWRNTELAQETWKTLPPHLKELSEQFTAGIQLYADEHPEEVPDFAMKLEPWMIQTIGRAMVLRWPLGTIKDDLNHKGGRPRPPQRSNEWAVSPERSADNIPILLSDPHLTWEGLAVMYEARVHAGDLHMNGYFLIGSPIMGIGHNKQVGWALTTGGPDTADVYEMTIRMQPQLEYLYDEEWKQAETKLLTIPVKGGEPVTRPVIYTHLGPVVAPPDVKNGKAYVGATLYEKQNRMFEQGFKMATSKNAEEFFQAVGMGQFNPQNIMFADIHGTIGYVRSGSTPIRPEGYDWSKPVPGDSSKTAWQGIHPVEDLVHIFNPEQGFMQNCNISPENMMPNSPFTPEKYRDYIFNVSWDTDNPRGKRTRELLDADNSVTKEEAIAYTMDVKDYFADQWKTELTMAIQAAGQEFMKEEQFAQAVQAIQNWDGYFTAKATATSLYKFWRLKCGNEIDLKPMAKGNHLDLEAQTKILELLQLTIDEMTQQYGSWQVAWGDIHKVGRKGQYFPCGGADFRSGNKEANFSETLFDVRSEKHPETKGQYVANNGSMAMILMFFHKDGIESLTCTPWGQSGHPDSSHFMDQGEKLYSKREMKPTWWKKEELMKNLESTNKIKIITK